ncbi:hypothetical protein FEM33_01370 [Dyadobacter flavalbus]|uniref:Por secretion system C-terminal sorting domain-containing protein n=1 Tax=Dyadobacter flavalbus TaxID=2579942 RepID=A0A5M8R3W2_9BACT|nr:hypothetical protein [Dyadobacter flavalbus]KAA6441664.1 hypothetical protein FEM33_01370 [Dyadobacter flavalbus]
MKISLISNFLCAAAYTLSLASFTTDKKNSEEKETAGRKTIQASLYKLAEGNKVKLSVDKSSDDKLKIILKDKNGHLYYSEVYNDKDSQYRRVFNLNDMNEGKYTFELFYNKQKVVKTIEIQSKNDKYISLN